MLNRPFYQLEPAWPGGAMAPQRAHGGWAGLRRLLALPFDLTRHAHAAAVHCGVLPRSMLESQRFERHLAAVEKLTLGPLARQV